MWCNNYTPPQAFAELERNKVSHSSDPNEPYDINCAIPLNFAALENERVKLTPFVPQLHAAPFLEQATQHPELFRYLPFPVPKRLEDIDTFLSRMGEPTNILLAVHDKTRPCAAFKETVSGGGSFAGTVALINTSLLDLSTEIGVVVMFPDFQRTHVLSNAVGLLITHCLNLSSDEAAPGIGYRRVQWLANSENVRSIKAAERLGFHMEGTIRWHRALPEGSEGMKPREDDPRGQCPGRHTAILSICWDDWVSGVKEKVKTVMDRK